LQFSLFPPLILISQLPFSGILRPSVCFGWSAVFPFHLLFGVQLSLVSSPACQYFKELTPFADNKVELVFILDLCF